MVNSIYVMEEWRKIMREMHEQFDWLICSLQTKLEKSSKYYFITSPTVIEFLKKVHNSNALKEIAKEIKNIIYKNNKNDTLQTK